MKSFDLLYEQGYVVLPCRPSFAVPISVFAQPPAGTSAYSGSQAATAIWYSKNSFELLPAIWVADELRALSNSPESR
jgi:hypothetical protein